MKIKFQIKYHPDQGQKLYIQVNEVNTDVTSKKKQVALHHQGNGIWIHECFISKESEYRYLCKHIDGREEYEFDDPRRISVENVKGRTLWLIDEWNDQHHPEVLSSTAPFKKVFFKNQKEALPEKNPFEIKFKLDYPFLRSDQFLGLLGSNDALGNWDEGKIVPLLNAVFKWDEFDEGIVEYKYVICDELSGKLMFWEERSNRTLDISKRRDNQSVLVHDRYFCHPHGFWKASGVAIPVFSIRTKSSQGVGDFSDLKITSGWAASTGMKVLQILPVNDTTANHTKYDSYPYATITVFGLHPMYGDITTIGPLKDDEKWKEIMLKCRLLNGLEEVDYKAVNKLKWQYYRLKYKEDGSSFLHSSAFKLFFEQNKTWLRPYAVFCYLRDKFKTPNFYNWGGYSKYRCSFVDLFGSESHPDFHKVAIHYYIQYHLHVQLKEATDHAAELGVVLKGDIPIGIYEHSVDAWQFPNLFNRDCQTGAPPDDFSITGQNWGFPTYNWEEMGKDGYAWWKERLIHMSRFFDITRIDHILGFFRIWEIPYHAVQGLLGRFNPSVPVSVKEIRQMGIPFDYNRYTKPYIRDYMVEELFGGHAQSVYDQYLIPYTYNYFGFKDFVGSQRLVKEHFDQKIKDSPQLSSLLLQQKNHLLQLHSEVLLTEAPNSKGGAWYPRIDLRNTYSYKDLDEDVRHKFDVLHDHFYYSKHDDFWRKGAMVKLPQIQKATNMLICGEDLGMIPSCVPLVMEALNILSLAVQRMPPDDREFLHPHDNSYFSVATTGSHDTSTIRQWWLEDSKRTIRYYYDILGLRGEAPKSCEPWIVEKIITQHLESPSILVILPFQDWLGMSRKLRSARPSLDRINVPAVVDHYWGYRSHLYMEDLIAETDFNQGILMLNRENNRL